MIMKYFNILAILKSNLWYKFVSYIYVIFCIYRYPKDVKCFLSNCRQLSINISFMFWLIFWKVINFVLTLFCGYSQSPSPLILVDSWLFSPSLSFSLIFPLPCCREELDGFQKYMWFTKIHIVDTVNGGEQIRARESKGRKEYEVKREL